MTVHNKRIGRRWLLENVGVNLLRVAVRYGDHLWEVNDSHSVLLVHHQVEFIEV